MNLKRDGSMDSGLLELMVADVKDSQFECITAHINTSIHDFMGKLNDDDHREAWQAVYDVMEKEYNLWLLTIDGEQYQDEYDEGKFRIYRRDRSSKVIVVDDPLIDKMKDCIPVVPVGKDDT